MPINCFIHREAKGLSKGRYDETFAGEDVIIMGRINRADFEIQCSCGLNISNFDNRTTSCPYTKR